MKLRKVIAKRIRHAGETGQIAADVNAVISANVGEKSGSTTRLSNRQRAGAGSGPTGRDSGHDEVDEGGRHGGRA